MIMFVNLIDLIGLGIVAVGVITLFIGYHYLMWKSTRDMKHRITARPAEGEQK